jgi:hypothetical protein
MALLTHDRLGRDEFDLTHEFWRACSARGERASV